MSLYEIVQTSKATQNKFEMWAMLYLAQCKNPQIILEIGVFGGGMVETLRRLFPRAKVIGIDIDFSKLEFTDFYAICGDSHLPSTREAVNDIIGHNPVDFLLIDGDHHYDSVKADFELYAPLLREGGMIAFHDTNSKSTHNTNVGDKQVSDYMKELDEYLSYRTIDILADPNSPGTRVMFI